MPIPYHITPENKKLQYLPGDWLSRGTPQVFSPILHFDHPEMQAQVAVPAVEMISFPDYMTVSGRIIYLPSLGWSF